MESKVITRIPMKRKLIALTFDDGQISGNTRNIVNILAAQNVKSTFFLTGYYVDNDPTSANLLQQSGHEIGNHSYSHPYLSDLNTEEITSQFRLTEEAVIRATGSAPKPFFRPPSGSYNSTVLDIAGSLGYNSTIICSIETKDWAGTSADIMINNVLSNAAPGAIVMMHLLDGLHTPEALPKMIKGLKSMGYQPTTLSQMFSVAYSSSLLTSYVVSCGDTLPSISALFNVPVENIVKKNNLPTSDFIYVGQVLTIILNTQNHTQYFVQPNDTLSSISNYFNVPIDTIAKINGLSNSSYIYYGQILIIPIN